MKPQNILISILTIIFGGITYYYTLSFPDVPGSITGPAFMPRIYAVLLIALGIILFCKSVFISNEEPNPNSKKVLLFILLFIIYAVLIPILGFYLSSILFLVMLLWMNHVKKVIYLVSVPAGVAFFLFVFFQQLLNVPLPTGFLL
ncbi:tripartite tricarboxylate transporter TctB family protein [Virgibacillus doumboii]|uniref:tripartite tricarboxylate transporter TctB family protein n=1 Tax=Virgibacillus doumboii TaxID=2697503 RepID=UPI0013DFAA44|nr:tripartite tricarboxylate transporter TctB family protein [Virgibacillus doumboii]